ncbi:unnamed protein product [Peniophora sp. CBMAI 1063]|nr:unnamed protein product [Peniophora sp. CBMAI 1063]
MRTQRTVITYSIVRPTSLRPSPKNAGRRWDGDLQYFQSSSSRPRFLAPYCHSLRIVRIFYTTLLASYISESAARLRR